MTYAKKVAEIAEKIGAAAKQIVTLESERTDWIRPEFKTFCIGGKNYYAVRKDGSVLPGLEGVQREALKLYDDEIFKAKSHLEGLRFKLANLGKQTTEGGEA